MNETEVEKDLAIYQDQYGLVQPEIGKTSQNGLCFTGSAILLLQDHDVLRFHWRDILKAYNDCEVRPGVWNRSPTNLDDQNSIDDYTGILVAAEFIDNNIAKRFLQQGRANAWIYNNTDKNNLFNVHSYFGRFPALICAFKMVANESPDIFDLLYLFGTFLARIFSNSADQDGWRLSWHLKRATERHSIVVRLLGILWSFRFHRLFPNGGMGENYAKYFQKPEHPLAKHLWGTYK